MVRRLGEPLGLVVDTAWPGGVDVAPVGLDLGMDLGVPVDLARACHEEAGLVCPGQLEQPTGALAADRQRVERPGEVGRRRGRRGQVAHRVDRDASSSSTFSLTSVTTRLKRS